ncbi:MAG: hypothetical protein QOF13_1434 [Solirubrobacterales bacterium]|jgi:hypothetical protein|nr:hypothetical protein [Solirubrobacterales bacterium]
MFKRGASKRLGAALLIAAAMAVLGVATAGATRVVAGNLVIDFGFGSAPKALPHSHDAPIKFWGHSTIGTVDGSAPAPVTHVTVEFDKFGHLETRGLARCTRAKLVATTPEKARRLCPGAIVGSGYGKAVITFPEQAPIEAGSAVTFFNGPEIGGDPSVIFHAHLDVPAPTTYLIPVRIERIHKGVYGYRIEATIPPIAGGYGAPTDFKFKAGRNWRFGGEELSYINARCPRSQVLRARIEAEFGEEALLHGSFLDTCRIRER